MSEAVDISMIAKTSQVPTGRVSAVQKVSYAVGHVLNELCGTMWFTYVLVYLQFVMQLPASTAGAILFAGQVVEAITTPIAGMESDRFKGCGNYGRRKSTHIFGTILTAVFFPFIFIELPGFEKASPEALLVYFIPVVFVFKVGWATTQTTHLSMIPELASDPSDRDDLAILRYTFDMIADMSVYFITWIAFSSVVSEESTTIDQSDNWRFRNIVLILIGLGVIFNVIFHLYTEEPKVPAFTERKDGTVSRKTSRHKMSTSDDDGKMSDYETVVDMRWSDWFREKHYFQVGILVVLCRLFINVTQAFLPLFLQEGIRAPQEYLAIIPGVCQFSALTASVLVKLILKFSTKKVAFVVGSCFSFAGCIWLGFDSPESVRSGAIYPLTVLIGAGTGMMLVVSTSFVSDLIGDNTESGAYVFGSIAFIHNLLNGLTVFLVQMGHGMCEDCPSYYRNVLAHGLSSISIISLFLVLFIEPPELGQRLSGRNTSEGREKLATKSRKYGSMQKGFPLLQRDDS